MILELFSIIFANAALAGFIALVFQKVLPSIGVIRTSILAAVSVTFTAYFALLALLDWRDVSFVEKLEESVLRSSEPLFLFGSLVAGLVGSFILISAKKYMSEQIKK